jgi:hypothetical protein
MRHLNINAVRSEALFVSAVQPSDNSSAGQVQQGIARAVRDFGSRGCAARVAQEFGDHPELAVARMRWARAMVDQAFDATRRKQVRSHRFVPSVGATAYAA